MIFTLFEDQKLWCRATIDALEKGIGGRPRCTRVLSVAATGAGKTIMASALAEYSTKRWQKRVGNGRVLFLADTDELCEQARDKIRQATGMIAGLEKAQEHAARTRDVVVASIQTLSRQPRLDTWDPDHFSLVIADEGHLSMADSWQRVLKYFNQDGRGAAILAVTATPERADEKDLWAFYEAEPANIGLFELIEKGRLAPIKVQTCPLKLDCRGIKARAGGLDEEALTHAIEPAFDQIIDAWEEYAEGRKTLWFLPGIPASKVFTDKLNRRGLAARHVDGTSPGRKMILAGFDDDRFNHLSNAQLLMKGYDQPDIGCVVVLRPVKSRVAYQQMVGRGTRVSPGKKNMLLLDFLWDFDKMMVRPADLVAGSRQEADRIDERMRGSQEMLDIREAKELAHLDSVRKLIERLVSGQEKNARTYSAQQAAAMIEQPGLLEYEPKAAWEVETVSNRQLEILQEEGIKRGSVKTKGEASQLISAIGKRHHDGDASLKQILQLHREGIQDPQNFTKKGAELLLDRRKISP
jgi:superfamily II DNA or RNA helicase